MSFSGARSLKNLYPSVKLKLVPSPLSYSVQTLATSELQKNRSYRDRSELKDAKRIVVKLGSAVITRTDGKGLALGRLASIVEEIAECHHQGKDLLLVSSGAVAFGHQKLAHQVLPSMTDWESKPDKSKTKNLTTLLDTRVAAAVGQSELMAMYEALFSQYNVKIAQILVTKQDFFNQKTKDHLSGTLADLRSLNVVPILNTNDAVSPMFLKDDTLGSGKGFDGLYLKDNDSLSALLATENKSDLLILMSDMQGIYDKPPWEPGSRVISTFTTKERDTIKYSWKSKTGNGDMRDTVRASTWALDRGVSVVVCNGTAPKTISNIFRGKKIGTFFSDQSVATTAVGVEGLANKAREASKMLLYLNGHERSQAIHRLIQLFDAKKDEIIKVNETDLMLAERNGVASNLRQSLGMNKQKLDNLKSDLDSIAKMNLYYVGKSFRTTILADNLCLQQITVPIGVVLVLLESRAYLILEAAAMAIATANGLIIKSSREAENTNNILMRIIREALKPLNAEYAVSLASYAETTSELLEMRKNIDLVIPRGSHNFVESIKSQSKIPVLGTSEGVCTIYIDDQADYKKALEIIIHAKCDSPTDENSMDTLLIHEKHLNGILFNDICNLFNKTNITVRAGHKLRNKLSFIESTAKSKQREYPGGLECSVEIVENVDDAIQYIGKFERAHTNSIVTENEAIAKRFLYSVDSACVFQNASTRLSNSAAFGLGPEIAFSTSKTPLRGPVGIEGLLTTKWIVEAKRDVINNQDVIM